MTTQISAAAMREQYLARLDESMSSLPHGVAREIRAGIVEELEGADAAVTARRIAQLGDPADIAREARAADADTTLAPQVVAAPATSTTETRGFAIFAALMLSFGGIVIPGVGWVIGAIMVCFSGLWRTWEKVTAILVPLVTVSLSIGFGLLAWTSTGTASAIPIGGEGEVVSEIANPLVPASYDLIWTATIAVGLLLLPASGLWLLWRMRRRVGAGRST